MPDQPLVIVSEDIDDAPRRWLAARCAVVRCTPAELCGLGDTLADAAGLVVRTYTRVDEKLLARAPSLKVVARAGVGTDNIDVGACGRRGIVVVNAPDSNRQAVVEFVLAAALDRLRPRAYLDRALSDEEWRSLRRSMAGASQLAGRTLGIYGLGRIGSAVARAASALGMTLIHHDLLDIPAERSYGSRAVSRDELLRSADVITLHVDGRPSNVNLISREALELVKADALIINAARGPIIDAPALAEFLHGHPGAAAVIDVHAQEPFDGGYALLGVANAWLTPHMAGATREAHEAMSWVVRDVWRVLSGERAEHAVTAPG